MYREIAAGLFFGGLASLAFSSSCAAEGKDCGLKRYASIDLEVAGTYLLVPVTIEGTRAYMALNLASPFSSFTEKAVGTFSLATKSMPANVVVHSGRSPVQDMATVTSFGMGELQFKRSTFLVLPRVIFPDNIADRLVIGILGMDVLRQFDIELDAAHRKMNLFSQDHCPGHTVYWAAKYDSAPIRFGSLGEFYFPMELEGKKLETTLATGNFTTTINTDATRKLFNFDSHSVDVETQTDSSGKTIAHYRAMKLSGEGLDIINARISLIEPALGTSCYLSSQFGAASYQGCLGAHPLALGQDVISKLHFYIATKEKVLYFTTAKSSD